MMGMIFSVVGSDRSTGHSVVGSDRRGAEAQRRRVGQGEWRAGLSMMRQNVSTLRLCASAPLRHEPLPKDIR